MAIKFGTDTHEAQMMHFIDFGDPLTFLQNVPGSQTMNPIDFLLHHQVDVWF